MRISKTITKVTCLVGFAGAVASLGVALPPSGPADAAVPPDLYKVSSPVTPTDATPEKQAIATCNEGDEVVGGGGWADDFGDNKVRLTRLEPTDIGSFIAEAEAPIEYDETWWLQAYAICAPATSVPGHNVESRNSGTSFKPFAQATNSCLGDQRVIGTGGKVEGAARQVGLQLVRSSGPMDIGRATGREDDGNIVGWSVTSYTICVDGLSGQHVGGALVDGPAGADFPCEDVDGEQTFVHGPGGGAGTTDAGPLWLNKIYPTNSLRSVEVGMTRSPSDGLIAVSAVCAQ